MEWLIFWAIALGLAILGRYIKAIDDVYALSIYSAGLFSALWGFVIAPTLAQLGLEVLTFGWLQLRFFRH